MKISQALRETTKPFVSFEFFPPADDVALKDFYHTVEKLAGLSPLFTSVTYGAGGCKADKTLSISRELAGMGFTVMNHLTCVGAYPATLVEYLRKLYDGGIENILALRGDPPRDKAWQWTGAFRHASDLVGFIRQRYSEMCIGCTAYPCPHPESETYKEDRTRTMGKLDAGADFAVTQLFFDVRSYYQLVSWLREHGCTKPIIPGILPIQSLASLKRVISMCGVSIPAKLYLELEDADRRGGAEEVRKIGTEFAVEQITKLLVGGAPGVHLYTLNKADLAMRIVKEAGLD